MTPDTDLAAQQDRTLELSPAERKALRAVAHHLDPVVAIGDAGLSESVLAETDRALAAHGLVKIRVHGDDRDRRLQMLDEICARLGCARVQAIGKLLVVWRPKPETGTGGNAGTARRRPGRQTKKAAGAGQTAIGGRPSRTSTKRQAEAAERSATRPPAGKGRSGDSGPSGPARPAPAAKKPARAAGGFGKGGGASKAVRAGKAGSSAKTGNFLKAGGAFRPEGTGKRPSPARPASAGASGTARPAAPGGSTRRAAAPLTRSARPVSGTRGRRRAP
jgi:RNA-binding protein